MGNFSNQWNLRRIGVFLEQDIGELQCLFGKTQKKLWKSSEVKKKSSKRISLLHSLKKKMRNISSPLENLQEKNLIFTDHLLMKF
jgi:hypothetical protein